MHLYSLDVTAAQSAAKQLTSGQMGNYQCPDVERPHESVLHLDGGASGERHFYTIPVDGGPRTCITTMTGSNEATVSPDETSLAILYSYSTRPPELYVMPFAPGAQARQGDDHTHGRMAGVQVDRSQVITYKAATASMSTRGFLHPK